MKKNRKQKQPQRLAPVIEVLEPRMLFSADIFGGAVDAVGDDPLADLLEDVTGSVTHPDDAQQPHPESSHQQLQPDEQAVDLAPFPDSEPLSRELVLIDPATPDSRQLLDDLFAQAGDSRQLEVVMLDANRDGIAQISDILQGRSGLDAIHLISHASDGAVSLGSSSLEFETLRANAGEIREWGEAFSEDGDFLIYGCELAASADGQALVDALGFLTRADVAASDDLTGHESLGGDWELEYRTGMIDTTSAVSTLAQNNWAGTLQVTTFEQGADGYTSTSDTYVSKSFPTSDYGSSTELIVNGSNNNHYQGLIRFDNIFGSGPNQIPLGSTINSASLEVNVHQTTSSGTVSLHALLIDWNDSASWDSLGTGAQLDDSEAKSTADSTISSNLSGWQTFSGLESALQAWSDGTANYGWVMELDRNGEWRANSTEGTFTPRLIVDFTSANSSPNIDLDADNSSGATGSDFTTTWTESGGAVAIIDADAVIADADDTHLESLTVTITNLADAPNETLGYNTSGTSITASYDAANGVLTLTGTDTVANYQAVLQTITYDNSSSVSDDTARIITFVANDGSGDSNTATATVTLNATNDPPVNTVPVAQFTAQDTDLIFSDGSGNAITVGDLDAGGNELQVTLSVDNGTLTLNTTAPVGVETIGNVTTTGLQGAPTVAYAPDGSYVMVWQDSAGLDGENAGIFAQRYASDGTTVGSEFQVNTTTSSFQFAPSIAMDDAGNFVVTWTHRTNGGSTDIYAQRFNASGVAQGGEFVVNDGDPTNQHGSEVAMNGNGDFVVTWYDNGPLDDEGIVLKRFDNAGNQVGSELQVNTTLTDDQQFPDAAIDDSGNVVVVWQSNLQDGSGFGIYSQRYDSSGTAQGGETLVNTTTASNQTYPSVAMDGSGNYVVVWQSSLQDGSGNGVYGQLFDVSGNTVGSEFQINQTTSSNQQAAQVSMTDTGEFVVAWESSGQTEDGSDYAVVARRFDASGNALCDEFMVNSTTLNAQSDPAVSILDSGDFVVAWAGNGTGDADGVFSQRFGAVPLSYTVGDGSNDTTVTFAGTVSEINTALEGLVYTPDNGFNGVDTLTITTEDQGNTGSGGTQSDVDTVNITVGISNTPEVDLNGADGGGNDFATIWTENGGNVVLVDTDATLIDSDENITSLSVTISNLRQVGVEVLDANAGATGLSVNYDSGTGELTIWGAGTAAQYQQVLRTVTYNNTSDTPDTTDRLITFTPTDAMSNGITATTTLSMAGVNDAPVNTVPGGQTTAQDADLAFSSTQGNAISISDTDAGSNQIAVTLSVDNGTLTLNQGVQPVGVETEINTEAANAQTAPDIAYAADGSYAVVWTSTDQDGDSGGIYYQRYDANGNAVGGEVRVNTFTANNQESPKIAMDDTGNSVVVWESFGQDFNNTWGVIAQRFDAAGNKVGSEFVANPTTSFNQNRHDVAMDSAGNFIVAWTHKSNEDIRIQRYAADGSLVGVETTVSTWNGIKVNPTLAMDNAGNAVIVWYTNSQDGSSFGITGQRIDASNNLVGAEFLVNTETAGAQDVPEVAMDAIGNFVVVWRSSGQDGDSYGVYAQRYDSAGVVQGSEFLVNETTTDAQSIPDIAMDDDGNFTITWHSNLQDSSGYGVYARQYDSTGTALTGEFLINTTTGNNQANPSISMTPTGDFGIAWSGNGATDTSGISVQRYAQGVPEGSLLFSVGDGTDDATMTFTGTIADINAVLEGLTYTPNTGFNGAETLTITADDLGNSGDGGPLQDADTVNITVGNANAPVIDLNGGDGAGNDFAQTWTENGGAVTLVDTDAGLLDSDENLTSLTVTITNLLESASESLSANPGATGLSVSYDSGTGVLTISGAGTAAQYEEVLRTVSYDNTSNSPNATARVITFTATDAISDGNTATTTLAVQATNDAPVNTVPVAQSTPQDTALVFSTGGSNPVTVGDPDAGSNELEITLSVDNGTLSLGPGAVGSGTAVNTITTDTQTQPVVAMNASGDYVVAWESNNQDGDVYGIYAQRFDAAGSALGGEFLVNTETASNQMDPSVAIDDSGNFVITWSSYGQDNPGERGIYAQRYDSSGNTVGGEFLVNSTTAGDQAAPSVAMDDDGDFVIVWQNEGAADIQGIFAQRYDSSGVAQGGETLVNTTIAPDQVVASVAMAGNGNYVVVWQSPDQDGDLAGAYGRLFDASGTPQGDEFLVNTTTIGGQQRPTAAMDADGDFAIAWTSYNQDGDAGGIYVQRYDATGAAQGVETLVNTTTIDNQIYPAMAMDDAGNFVITWWSYNQDGDGRGVYGQRFDASGEAVGGEFRVNTTITGDQIWTQVAMDADGDFVVTYQSDHTGDNDIYMQRYQSTSALTFTAGDGANDATITFSGTSADINKVLDGLTYSPNSGFNGVDTLTVTLDDQGNTGTGGSLVDTDTVNIAVGNPNAPVIDLNGGDGIGNDFAQTWTENGGAVVLVDVDGSLIDTDENLTSLTVIITNLLDGASESLSANAGATGLAVGYDSGTGALTISGIGTAAQYEQVLRTVTYDNTSENPDATARVITFTATDAISDGNTVATTLSIDAVNDAPVNTVPGMQTTAQDTDLVFSSVNSNAVTVGDVDADTVEVTLTATNGTLTVDLDGVAGDETLINTTTTDVQQHPDIAVAADGSYVVTWASQNQDGDGWGTYAQRFDAAGNALTGEILVSTSTNGDQQNPSVAIDDAGNFVVAWETNHLGSGFFNVYAQRFDADGNKLGSEFRVDAVAGGDVINASVAMDADGDYVIAFENHVAHDGDGWGIYARRYDNTGASQGGAFLVNTSTTGNQAAPSVAMDDAGNFVVAWGDASDSSRRFQLYDNAGNELGGETVASGAGFLSRVSMNASGDFVVVWQSTDSDSWGVFARQYDATGTAIGAEFQVNTFETSDQATPDVALANNGEFVVTWQSFSQDAAGAYGIYAQRYDALGAAVDSEFLVNTTTAGGQIRAAVAMDDSGRFTVTWNGNGDGDADGVFIKRYGVPVAFSAGDGIDDASMTFRGSVTDVNTALEGLVFTPTPGYNGPASVQIQVSDLGGTGTGGTLTDTDTIDIVVGSFSSAPVVTLPGATVNYTENDLATVIDSTATVSDSDSADFDGGTLTVDFTANSTANDRLAIRDQGPGIGNIQVSSNSISYEPGGPAVLIGTFTGGTDGSTPLVITFNAAADDAAVQAVMRNITYENVSDNPSELMRTVRFVVTDGDGGTSAAVSENINIGAVNDDPTNAGTMPTDLVFLQDTQGKLNLSAIDLSDVDAKSGSLTLTITSDSGHLQTLGWPGVTLGSSQSQLILTGSLADLNDFLNDTNSIDYEHATPGMSGNNVDRITIEISDNGNTGSGGGGIITLGMINIDIDPVAPQIDLDADDSTDTGSDFLTTWTQGGGQIKIADTDATVFDADSVTLQSMTVTLTNHLDGADERMVADVSGTNISVTYAVGPGEFYAYLNGVDTVANYEQVLRSIVYDNTAANPEASTRVITVQASDGTNVSTIATTTIDMSVTNVSPTIISDGGGDTANISVTENTTAVTTVTADDIDGDTPTFSITGGLDSTLFDIDSNTGALSFKTAPDYETPGDVDTDNVYEVQVTAEDGNGGADVQTINVTVTNVSDNTPVSNADAYSVNEDGILSVDWWDADWSHRQQITFDNLAQSETLTDFPVLIVLNSGSINYALTNDDGSDLRFFSADGTPLAYQIEEWNESDKSSVWVRVPQIIGGSDTESITMYYGNAAAEAPNTGNVWDSDFVGVWHLNEEQGGSGNGGVYQDATGQGHDGVDRVAATGQEGQAGTGQEFGTGDWVEIDHDSALDLKDSMTISFWIKPTSDSGTFNRVVEKGLWGYNDSYYFGGGNGTNDLTFYLNGQEVIDTADNVLTVDAWQHAAVSYTSNGDGTGTARMYLDGVEIATGNYTNGAVVGNTGSLAIGHENSSYDFDGFIDEVQISITDRSADWIAAQYKATRNQSGSEFVHFGVPETAPATDGVLTNDTDADNDLLTASIVSGPSNAAAFTFNKDGTFSYTPDADFNGTDTFTYRVNDGSVDSATKTVTISVDPVNDPIVISTDSLASPITEDSVSAGFVVAQLSATDEDGGNITFSISDTTNYAIDAGSGEVTLTAAGAVLVNAGNDLPDFDVTAESTTGSTSTDTVTVNPTDTTPVNDPIVISTDSLTSPITEAGVSAGFVVAQMGATDEDGGNITFSISDTTNYAIDAGSGEVTLTAAGAVLVNGGGDLPDFDVTAESTTGSTSTDTVTVNPTDTTPVNDPIVISTDSLTSPITEAGVSAGFVVAQMGATDEDGGNITFSISDTTNYAIDAGSGEVTLTAAGAALVNAGNDLPDFDVTAESTTGSTSTDTVTVNPTDTTPVNDPIVISTDSLTSPITEAGVSAGFVVAQMGATDEDGGNITFSISDTTNYAIDAGSGEVTLTAAGAALVNAGNDLPDFDVTAESTTGSTSTDTVTVNPTDTTPVNDPIVISTDSLTSPITEAGVSAGFVVAQMGATDEDGGNITFSISDTTNYAIDAGSGEVTLTAAGAALVNGGGDLPDFDVTAESTTGSTSTDTVTVNPTDTTPVNDPIVISTDSLTSPITEAGVSAGFVVAQMGATDEDGGNITFSISDTTNYAIDAGSGEVTLTAAGAVLVNAGNDLPDFDVTATSTTGSTSTDTVTVNPTDTTPVNDPIVISTDSLTSPITEAGVSAGFVVAQMGATDEDGGNITFSISDTTNYAIDAGSGEVTLTAAGAVLVNAGNDLPDFDVTATSTTGSTSTDTVTVNPTDTTPVNDPIVISTDSLTSPITEAGVSAGFVVAQMGATDEDGGNITFSISDTTNYAIDAGSGEVTLTAAGAALVNGGGDLPDFDVTATSTTGSTSTDTVTVNPTDTTPVNDPIVISTDSLTSPITEAGVSAGFVVAQMGATDEDGGNITFSISDTTNYAIDAGSGEVTLTAAGAALVNAGNDLPDFDVTAESTTGSTSTDTVTVNPTDTTPVNDPIVISTDSLTSPITEAGVSAGFVVAQMGATDEDGGNITFSISDTTNYAIDAGSGEVTLTAAGAALVNAGNDLPDFDVTAESTTGSTSTDTVTVNPTDTTPVNDPIVISTDSLTSPITEAGVSAGFVVAQMGATDEDGGNITFSISDTTNYAIDAGSGEVTLTAAGAALVNGGGDLPDFDVTATSTTGSTSTDTVTVNPTDTTPVNDPIVISTDSLTSPITEAGVSAGFVVAQMGATDEDGGNITFSISDTTNYAIDAGSGEVTLTAAGAALVNAGNDLPDFDVTAESTTGSTSTDTVTVNPTDTTPVNDPIVISTDSLTSPITEAGVSAGFVVAQLSATDEDGGNITFSISDTTNYAIDAGSGEVTLTAAGAALVNGGGDLPDFDVTATSTTGSTSTDTVTVNPTDTTPVNDAPVLNTASLSVTEGATVTLTGADFGITDADDTSFTFALSGISGGQFELTTAPGTPITGFNSAQLAANQVVFVDNGDEVAPSFSITVNDGDVDSNTLAASITYTPANDAPTTAPVTLSAIAEDSGVRVITQAQLLTNASDTEGDSLTAAGLAINAGAGSLVDNGDGTWNYTPAADDDTGVSFNYTITDGTDTVAGSAGLDITPVNDAPTTTPVTIAAIAEDSGIRVITQAELLANATDTEGDSLTAAGLAISAGAGSLVDNGDGTWNYTLAANDATDISFGYSITDGIATAAGSASLDITAVNDVPLIGGVSTGVVTEDVDPDQDNLLESAGTLTISDPDDGESSFQAGTVLGTSGSLTIDAAGHWRYTADNAQESVQQLDAGEHLTDTLTVTSADGTPYNVILTIQGVDDAPVVSTAHSVVETPPVLDNPQPGSALPTTSIVSDISDEEPEKDQESDAVDEKVEEGEAEASSGDTGSDSEEVSTAGGTDTALAAMVAEAPAMQPVDEAILASALADLPERADRADRADRAEYQRVAFTPIPPKSIDLNHLDIAPFEPVETVPVQLKSLMENSAFVNGLEEMNRDLDEAVDKEETSYRLGAETAVGVSMSLSAGFVSWVLRTGSLMAGFMSMVPMWKQLDPLPILGAAVIKRRKEHKEQEETKGDESGVEEIFEEESLTNRGD